MQLRVWARCAAVAAAGCELLRLADASLPRTLLGESEALALLQGKEAPPQCDDPEAASWLIGKGWWNAARELVTGSHRQADGDCRANIEKIVRREVTDMKLKTDALLLSLSPPDAKVGTVRCSFQWAQNSSAVFLTVKFSHRWSSPGALKVHDEKASVSDCCFNFSAAGEHSQLRKRYTLDLNFFQGVDIAHWRWDHASAGRLKVEIRKKDPAKWPRLLASKEKPGNMAMWESMHGKWAKELEEWEKQQAKEKKEKDRASGKSTQKSKDSKGDVDDDDQDEQLHEDGEKACYDSKHSPFHRERYSTQLCEAYWPANMKGKRGTETPWLVLFYSISGLKCRERSKECTAVYDKWVAIQKVVADNGQAKTGIVECDANSAFCSKHKLGHMPFVRRYKDGKKKTHYGDWDIDTIMKFVLA